MTDKANNLVLTPEIRGIMRLIKEAGGKSYLVGGYIRDYLYENKIGHDIDMVTTLIPDKIEKIFRDNNFKVITIGKEFGSITLVEDYYTYEITTLREDISTDGRYAKVKYGTDLYKDSCRRDFTINALYMDEKGVIYDYHNGKKDIAAGKVIKFIGDQAIRIKEDYLRICRFYRFLADSGKAYDASNTVNIIASLASNMRRISKERILKEMYKTVAGKYFAKIIPKFLPYQVITSILQFNIVNLNLKLYNHLYKLKTRGLTISDFLLFVSLFVNMHEDFLKHFLKSWPITKAQKSNLRFYLNFPQVFKRQKIDEELIAMLYTNHKQNLLSTIWLNPFIGENFINKANNILPLPYNIETLTTMAGLDPKKIGYLKKIIIHQWIKSNYTLSYNEIRQIINSEQDH